VYHVDFQLGGVSAAYSAQDMGSAFLDDYMDMYELFALITSFSCLLVVPFRLI
jgi:hypothetical protein